MESQNDMFFTEPIQSYTNNQISSIKDLNNLSLRQLRFKNKEAKEEIHKYQSRIKYLRDRDHRNLIKEFSQESKKQMLDVIRRQYSQTKQINQLNKKKRQQERKKIIALSLEERFKKNSLRVYNAQMQKKQKVKMTAKFHNDNKQKWSQNLIFKQANQELLKQSNQKDRRQLVNSIARKKIQSLVHKQHITQQLKLYKLKLQKNTRIKYEQKIKNLIQKEKQATQKLEIVTRFRQDQQQEYFQMTGYSRSHRSQFTDKIRSRRLSETRSFRFQKQKTQTYLIYNQIKQSKADQKIQQIQSELAPIPKNIQNFSTSMLDQVEQNQNYQDKCDIFIS